MSDIFISYAHSTLAEARQVADGLRALGYSVWRDNELPPHRVYADVIADRLQAAKAVVVIWSSGAVKSEWVRSEANRARREHKLVQLTIDGSALPMPFDQTRCVDMRDWTGDRDAEGWRIIVASVAELVGDGGADPTTVRAAKPGRATTSDSRLSICVLPFENMSADPEQDYFSDGITEDIITDLSKVAALLVVARSTAFAFKGKAVTVQEVGRALSVSHVLEGSVRKAGGRVRITAQLINAATSTHIWADRWDRELTDIFALQDEISQAVVAALRLKLLPEEIKAIEQRGTTSHEAYDLYLMARQLRAGGNEGNPHREDEIIRLTDRATKIDPDYANAWALMALSQSVLHFHYRQGEDDGLAAAQRALALNPDLADAHAVKARHLTDRGQAEEAMAELQIALHLDPDCWEANKQAGLLSFRQRQFDDASRYYRRATDLTETDYTSPMMLMTSFEALGDLEAASSAARITHQRAQKAVAQDPSSGSAMATGCMALAFLGETSEARDWARRALLVDPHNVLMRYNLACTLSAHLKDVDGALELLEGFFAMGEGFLLAHAKVDPDLDPVRDDPRFKSMISATEARLAARSVETRENRNQV